MDESLRILCERFIENRDTVKSVFRMEYDQIYAVCANIFCARGLAADADRLEACKALIKEKTGIFSTFRGTARPPVACLLAVRDDPSAMMEQTLICHEQLKQHFWGSDYLALAAFLLADMTKPGEAAGKAARGRAIYDRMKKEHPLLTSSEDSVFSVLMAFSEKDDDALVSEMETCYDLLRRRFHSGNVLQSVSHVLTLADGAPESKVQRLEALYDSIREAGGKYGKNYELATLAALSILDDDVRGLSEKILEADAFLAGQKGYGFFGLDRRTRMMHAAMIVSDLYLSAGSVEAAALTGTLAIIAAQQAAMCAVIISSTSAAAAASSSH